jgi:hypothetical protein
MDKIEAAVNMLRRHNRWRRGDLTAEMVDPALLGAAIDIVCDELDAIGKRDLLIWDAEDPESGCYLSEHDYLIAMSENSGEENIIGMEFQCTMARSLPGKALKITAVDPVTGNPSEWDSEVV